MIGRLITASARNIMLVMIGTVFAVAFDVAQFQLLLALGSSPVSGLDHEIHRPDVSRPGLDRADHGHQRSAGPDQGRGPLLDLAADEKGRAIAEKLVEKSRYYEVARELAQKVSQLPVDENGKRQFVACSGQLVWISSKVLPSNMPKRRSRKPGCATTGMRAASPMARAVSCARPSSLE